MQFSEHSLVFLSQSLGCGKRGENHLASNGSEKGTRRGKNNEKRFLRFDCKYSVLVITLNSDGCVRWDRAPSAHYYQKTFLS